MMKLTFLPEKKPEKKQQEVDIRESFALWDTLAYKYLALERLLLWENFAHDPDLKAVLILEQNHIKEHIGILEKLMALYSIPSPEKNRTVLNTPVNPQLITDRFIALDLLLFSQESVEGLLTAFRNCITNDKIRTAIYKMLVRRINYTDSLIKYNVLRGFIGVAPPFQQLSPNANEELSSGEAGNLWDHLSYRYDNINYSEMFNLLIHDKDFQLIVGMGLKSLRGQAELLEKELEHFGLPSPRRPGNVTMAAQLQQLQDDIMLFRHIFLGMQGATMLHAKAFKQCMSNNRVRNLFKKLLLEEVDKLDAMIRFGKLKGWLSPVPSFGS